MAKSIILKDSEGVQRLPYTKAEYVEFDRKRLSTVLCLLADALDAKADTTAVEAALSGYTQSEAIRQNAADIQALYNLIYGGIKRPYLCFENVGSLTENTFTLRREEATDGAAGAYPTIEYSTDGKTWLALHDGETVSYAHRVWLRGSNTAFAATSGSTTDSTDDESTDDIVISGDSGTLE